MPNQWNTYRFTVPLTEDVVGWNTYRKVAPVFARQMDKPFRVTTKEGPVEGKAGDYLCLGVENEAWPVDRDIFEKTMVKVRSGVSRKLRETIRKAGSGYRLVSHTGKNLGDFPTQAAAEQHEREVEYFKRKKG